jgi:hypothetical protein
MLGDDSGRMTGYPEVIHTDEKALAIPIFRNPTFSGLRYRRLIGRDGQKGIQGIPPITMSSILGCVAPVMAMVSPSQPRPAVIHKTSISVSGPVCAKVVILQRDPGRDFQHEQHFKPSCGERRG